MHKPLVFFVDIDNILLDNERVVREIKHSLIKVLGHGEANYFWKENEELRSKAHLVNFPKVIKKYCTEKHEEACELKLKNIFYIIDFKMAMFPTSYDVLKHLKTMGRVVIFTEGDRLYQKQKIERLELGKLVDKIYLYRNKSEHIDAVLLAWKNFHPVFIDDRSEKLSAIKKQHPKTKIVEVCQGHYSNTDHVTHKKLDKTIESIEEILKLQTADFY